MRARPKRCTWHWDFERSTSTVEGKGKWVVVEVCGSCWSDGGELLALPGCVAEDCITEDEDVVKKNKGYDGVTGKLFAVI